MQAIREQELDGRRYRSLARRRFGSRGLRKKSLIQFAPRLHDRAVLKRSELADVHYHLAEALFALGKIFLMWAGGSQLFSRRCGLTGISTKSTTPNFIGPSYATRFPAPSGPGVSPVLKPRSYEKDD
jgi:hypothetical protein